MPEGKSRAVSKKGGWWQTMPGMLTATAGIITAVAGLLVALHQAGLLGGKQTPGSQPSPGMASQTLSDTTKPTGSASNDSKYSVTFPSGTKTKFDYGRGQGTYEILAAQAERRSTEKLVLKFTIRLTNHGPSDVGFWDDSFRLLLDGVPRAPVSRLIDSVEARSAKEADVEFEVPDTAKNLALQVLVGDKKETIDMPLTLNR